MTNDVPTPRLDPPTGQRPPWQARAHPHPHPQLRRSSTDSMIGGVSGGLAEYSGIDPLFWRAGFVGLSFAGGAGAVIYLPLWALVPSWQRRPDEALSPLEQGVQRMHVAVDATRSTSPNA